MSKIIFRKLLKLPKHLEPYREAIRENNEIYEFKKVVSQSHPLIRQDHVLRFKRKEKEEIEAIKKINQFKINFESRAKKSKEKDIFNQNRASNAGKANAEKYSRSPEGQARGRIMEMMQDAYDRGLIKNCHRIRGVKPTLEGIRDIVLNSPEFSRFRLTINIENLVDEWNNKKINKNR